MLALITDLPVATVEVHPSVPAKTVAEFVAYAKQNPGQTQFRIGRHRRHHSSGRRDVQADGRRRHGARRLQGRRPCADRSDIGQYPVDVRHARHRAAAGEGRIAAAARRSARRNASPICLTCRPSPRAAIPIPSVSARLAFPRPQSCPTISRKNSLPVSHKALGDDTFRASLEKVGFLPLRPKSQAEDRQVRRRPIARGGRV